MDPPQWDGITPKPIAWQQLADGSYLMKPNDGPVRRISAGQRLQMDQAAQAAGSNVARGAATVTTTVTVGAPHDAGGGAGAGMKR